MKHLFFILLLLSFAIGCNNNNPQGRVPVRGEVTLNGQPLAQGNVLFSSLPGTTPTVVTGSPIKNGTFSLSAEHGLIPNQEYLVQFSSVEEVPGTRTETDDPMSTKVKTRNIIPPQYGTESKETVTATKKSPNVYRFELIDKTAQ
ncbi:MAG: hypothetical protein LBK82_15830 [Planctomycetaceae bacterium]|jgi:hypothetical protein|nr:hypothetical protein [Planctomycetaceae bacterium]